MPNPNLTDEQTKELTEIVVVANTPSYLGRKLRENSIVRDLSRSHSALELMAYVHEAIANDQEVAKLSVVTRVYAALVAAMMRRDFAEALGELGVPKLRWAEELIQQAEQQPSTNNNTIIVSERLSTMTSRSGPPSAKPVGQPIGSTIVLEQSIS